MPASMTSLLFISKRTLLGGDGSTASPPVSGARTLPSRATMLPWPLPANPDLPHCNKAMPSYDIIYLRWCAIESRVRRGLTDRHAQFMLTEAEWTDFRLHAREAHLHQFARMFPVGGTLMCSGPPGGGPCTAPDHQPSGFRVPLLPGTQCFSQRVYHGPGRSRGRDTPLCHMHIDHQPGLKTSTLPKWREALVRAGQGRFLHHPSWAAGLDPALLTHLCFSPEDSPLLGRRRALCFRCGGHETRKAEVGRIRLYPCHPDPAEQWQMERGQGPL